MGRSSRLACLLLAAVYPARAGDAVGGTGGPNEMRPALSPSVSPDRESNRGGPPFALAIKVRA